MRRILLSLSAAVLLGCSGNVASGGGGGAGGSDSPAPDAGPSDAPWETGYPDREAGDDAGPDVRPDGPADIGDALSAIPGLTVTSEYFSDPYRVFSLEIEQPVDHDHPGSEVFHQRLTLLHRSADAPMVLYSTGYFLFGDADPSEIAYLSGANQLAVEHRFFAPSAPSPIPWQYLTIAQAAADHHRIVEAFRPLYGARWLSTGHSKGGMTSVYHRRFYPDDVDATVAYVAPLSFTTGDERYVTFLEQVGDPVCRQQVVALQRRLLERKSALLPWMGGFGAFSILGTEKAFEHGVVELPFTFWQYSGSGYCSQVPFAPNDTELWDFFAAYSGVAFTTDDQVVAFRPYFQQAGTQLGYPAFDESSFEDLETYPGTDRPDAYVEPGMTLKFDAAAMADVDTWVRSGGRTLMFLYGENDPWSAGAFELGVAADSYRYFVPEGTHGSLLTDLPASEKAEALGTVSRWLDVPVAAAFTDSKALEAIREHALMSPM